MAGKMGTLDMEPLDHVGGGGDSDHDVDDTAHEKLLNSLFAMDGKRRLKNDVRGISTQSGNLDLAVHAKKDDGKIKPEDLKLKLKSAAPKLKKPMSGLETEMAKREIARETVLSEMKAWEPVVQEIRSAPQVIFANRPHGVEMRNAMRPKGFTPRTPLEKELFAALGKSEDVLCPNKELTKAEERALKAMSVKEAMERRAELLKHNELLSRAQVRAKRVKKIKSKRYRKIMRKEKEGATRKELEKLQTEDPEAFVERMEQLERDRMEERLTLKHRGGGKFARLHKVYSKFDDKTREAMQDMLQKSRELTKKTKNVSSSEDDDDEEETVDQAALTAKLASKDVKDEDDDTAKANSESVRATRLEMLKAINKKAGGWLDGPKSTFVYVGGEGQTPAQGDSGGQDSTEPVREGETEMASPLRAEDSSVKDAETEIPSASADTVPSEAAQSSSPVQKRIGKRKAESLDEDEEDGEEAGDADEEVMEVQKSPVVEQPKKKKRKRNRKKGLAGDEDDDNGSSKSGAKPKERPVVETTLETVAEAAGDEEDDNDDALKVTMEELFQDEDVVEEFAREKAAAEERARPKVEDTRLPGWGSWAGPDYKGEKPLTKKQKRAEARAKQLERQRKKVQQPHVWLNPNGDEAIRKLQPKTVPFPYTSVQQYEASMRQPVSRGFVRETAFKLLNKPEVVTKLGSIIRPLDKEEIFKKKKTTASDTVEVRGGAMGSKEVQDKKSEAGRGSSNYGGKSGGAQKGSSINASVARGKKEKQKRKGIS